MQAVFELVWILALDVLFVGVLTLLMVPLGIYKNAAFAVLKRNFVGYFSNPTGYVFLCLFVLLTSFFAFCLPEFFTSNLANFDQLNRFLPLIMLIFVPAITMSIWAEEKRQGTDELLLTLPAADFDIVMGKYLAAVCVFTVSLIFSQLCNYFVLIALTGGDLDTGLLFSTYFGYWLMGVAMLAIGMVASFFTRNLTVGFVLGILLNAPLVLASYLHEIASFPGVQEFARFGLLGQFEEFGHGVISISSLIYFIAIASVQLYVCVLLIWNQRQGATYAALIIFWIVSGVISAILFVYSSQCETNTLYTMMIIASLVTAVLPIVIFAVIVSSRGMRTEDEQILNYLIRATALVVIAFCLSLFATNTVDRIIRFDLTRNQVASLHGDTRKIIRNLDKDRPPVMIEAYVGDEIPPDYVKTRRELITRLRDLEAKSHGRVQVTINEGIAPFSPLAKQAEKRFGIAPQTVVTRHRGAMREERVILGAAFECGLDRVVVPFFDYGIPVEYELIRSINTVSKGERKKIGVVGTDARMMGGFIMHAFQSLPKQPIVEELEKQYDVEEVSAGDVILDEPFDPKSAKYDVLLVVQPSSLEPAQLDNLLQAVENGQPTAIFEDPLPAMMRQVTPTSQPKPPRGGGMMGMRGGPPPEKCDIKKLWDLLNIKVVGKNELGGNFQPYIISQNYQPYRKVDLPQDLSPEWVFISEGAPGIANSKQPREAFNSKHDATAGLAEVLFPFPGALEVKDPDNEELTFAPLTQTGRSGQVPFNELNDSLRGPQTEELNRGEFSTFYTTSAQITAAVDEKDGEESDSDSESDSSDDESASDEAEKGKINVIYVADADLLSSGFVRVRAAPDQEMNWKFENVTFVLNIIDVLAGESDYVGIRKRKPKYTTLTLIEGAIEKAHQDEEAAKKDAQKKFDDEVKGREDKIEKKREELQQLLNDKVAEARRNPKRVDLAAEVKEIQQRFNEERKRAEKELNQSRVRLGRERDDLIDATRDAKEQEIENLQTRIRAFAVVLPPIPPLIVGLVVFVIRRLREREGVSRERLV